MCADYPLRAITSLYHADVSLKEETSSLDTPPTHLRHLLTQTILAQFRLLFYCHSINKSLLTRASVIFELRMLQTMALYIGRQARLRATDTDHRQPVEDGHIDETSLLESESAASLIRAESVGPVLPPISSRHDSQVLLVFWMEQDLPFAYFCRDLEAMLGAACSCFCWDIRPSSRHVILSRAQVAIQHGALQIVRSCGKTAGSDALKSQVLKNKTVLNYIADFVEICRIDASVGKQSGRVEVFEQSEVVGAVLALDPPVGLICFCLSNGSRSGRISLNY